jgi:hypothetical protein
MFVDTSKNYVSTTCPEFDAKNKLPPKEVPTFEKA